MKSIRRRGPLRLILIVALSIIAVSADAASPNDTVILAGSTNVITDANGNTWGITSGGQISNNGTTNTGTSGVTELAYVNGTVWAENTAGNWYSYTSTGGYLSGPAGSPLPFTPSANDATITTVGPVLTDAYGNTWGITSGQQIVENGATNTGTSGVVELAYVSGTIWAENTQSNWYSYTPSGAYLSGPAASPLPASTSASGYAITAAGQTPAIYDASGEAFTLANAFGIPSGTIRVMPLGDSITEGDTVGSNGTVGGGYVPGGYRLPAAVALENAGFNITYVGSMNTNSATGLPSPYHEGHPGYQVSQIQNGIDSNNWLGNNPADIILLLAGTNDLYNGTGISGSLSAYSSLLADIKNRLPNAKIIVSTLTPRGDATGSMIASYNSQLETLVQSEGANVSYVDNGSAVPLSDISSDNIHPNQAGYNVMGPVWAAGVEALYPSTSGALVVQVNGVTDTTAVNPKELLYYNNLVYYENTSNVWFSKPNAAASWTNVGADPRTVSLPSTGPKGITTPAQLVAYFNSIAGKQTVSGQFLGTSGLGPIDTIQQNTGYYLGAIECSYWPYSQDTAFDSSCTTNAETWWQAGGLVTMNISMPNPTTQAFQGSVGGLAAGDLTTPGTPTNTNLNNYLTQMGNELLKLQAAGVVVIVRCWHEMDGSWDWWGYATNGSGITAQQYIALYQYTWTYFHNLGVNNVVYEWAVNASCCGGYTQAYPGGQYVDMVGFDVYDDNAAEDTVADYNTLAQYGKPIAMAEFGPGNSDGGDTTFKETTLISQISQYEPNVVYFMQWWAGGSPGWDMADTAGWNYVASALSNSRVVNRGGISYTSGTPLPPTGGSSPGQPIFVNLN